MLEAQIYINETVYNNSSHLCKLPLTLYVCSYVPQAVNITWTLPDASSTHTKESNSYLIRLSWAYSGYCARGAIVI